MNSFSFSCSGHENILSLHRNTIEFTREKELTKNGDCIIGVNADFDYGKLMEFIEKNKNKRIKGEIIVVDVSDGFSFVINPDFSDTEEIVIRKGDFNSKRTLGFNLDKAAKDIKRELVEKIKGNRVKIQVIFTNEEKNS